jgi:hypothetical protein
VNEIDDRDDVKSTRLLCSTILFYFVYVCFGTTKARRGKK